MFCAISALENEAKTIPVVGRTPTTHNESMSNHAVLNAPTATRLPLNYLSIPFGLSGIAGTWTIAATALGAPDAVGLALWALAAVAWLGVLTRYFLRAARAGGSVLADLRHPFLGPFGSLAPVVGILIGGALGRVWLVGGSVLVAISVTVIVILSAWLLAEWMTGSIDARIFHPGNYLTIVAGGLIGAIGLAQVGATTIALIALGVGVFFWAVLAAVVIARLVATDALPDPLVPSLTIFSVPPSVAGIAWFAINGETIDVIHQILLGIMLFLLLSQLFLVPRYARIPFGVAYWSFTFTVAAPATYGIHWLWLTQPVGWQWWSWFILIVVTVWIGGIALRFAAQSLRARR
jgi:tellurite resistance protein